MKINFKHAMLAFAALTLGFTSCNNDNDDPVITAGEETFMELKISFPQMTRATTDANATDEEVKLNSISVFIFDGATSAFLTRTDLTLADFNETEENDKYTSKKIPTTTGAKKIYVGMNLPASFPSTVATITDLKKAWTMTPADLSSNGITMFCNAEENKTLVKSDDPTYDTANSATFTLERMVAKIAVQAASTLNLATTDNSGVIKSVRYAIAQSNTKIYPFQLIESNIVKDPNWATTPSGDLEDLTTDVDDYVAMDASATAIKSLASVRYAPENTTEQKLQKEITYLSVVCEFVPNEFLDGSGNGKGDNSANAPKTFWVVSLSNGSKNYFDVESEADTYMSNQAALSPTKSTPYKDGLCYYNMFLNKTNTIADRENYDVYRNDFYHCTISKIIAPGKPGPGIDPEVPPTTETDIFMELNIKPWVYVTDDYQLI